jgi:hypothetical protein
MGEKTRGSREGGREAGKVPDLVYLLEILRDAHSFESISMVPKMRNWKEFYDSSDKGEIHRWKRWRLLGLYWRQKIDSLLLLLD